MFYNTNFHNPFLFPFPNPFLHSPSPSLLSQEMERDTKTTDDFQVDQFLDFSNDFSEETPEEEKPEPEKKIEPALVTQNPAFISLPEPDLPIHVEESLESLEWLSHFVEDSFSNYPLTGKIPTEPATPVPEPRFTTPVQTKARTKRARTGIRIWPVLSPESSGSSGSSGSDTFQGLPKKQKRKMVDESVGPTRRCTHCLVTKTPQWRAGPAGPKTLCNACGVRFKSGRLLPEYRPACSPTFSSELHSNNHRKVMEMRKQRDVEGEGTGLGQPVRSF